MIEPAIDGRGEVLWRSGAAALFISLLAMSALIFGCSRRGDHSPSAESKPSVPSAESAETESSEESVSSYTTVKAPSRSRPEAVEGLTADGLLRAVCSAYQKAKLYSDHGYIEAVYQTDRNGAAAERTACSVIFKKPNFIRMEIGGGILTCDGEKIRGRLQDPFYNTQRLELPAPLQFSSIRELYPDVILAGAMDTGTPPTVFWAPPQLIFLLAKEPLRTLVPKDSKTELLEPDWLSFQTGEEPIACDRVAIRSEDGTRILWIDRRTRGVLRFEFPLERISVPEDVERVLSLTMNFPHQTLSEDPAAVTMEPDVFRLAEKNTEEPVDRFFPPELYIFGKRVPSVHLKPMVSGYSDVVLDQPQGKCRVLCFWGGGTNTLLPIWERSQTVLKEFQRSAKEYEGDDRLEFLAVNIDPPARSDSMIRSEYGELSLSMPLYRMALSEMQKTIFARLSVPSMALIDADGVVQKYYASPVSYVKLQYQLAQMLDGMQIYREDFKIFEARSQGFQRTVTAAEESDVYRTAPESDPAELKIAAKESPSTFSLTAEWHTELLDAGNPLAVSDPPAEASGEVKKELPFESLIVPCEGNVLVILDADGSVVRRCIPETAAGEPISFVRTIRTADGARHYAASAFLDSRRVHLFDGDFHLLGTLDVSQPSQQWVSDVQLTDRGADSRPEVIMALIGDVSAKLIPTHGIYAVEMMPEKKTGVLWKDEKVVTPYRLGLGRSSAESAACDTVWSMNFPEDEVGTLVSDRLSNGERMASVKLPEDRSMIWFATDAESPENETMAALVTRVGQERPSFVLLNGEGEILGETLLEIGSWGPQTERIVSGDIDSDGKTEWLVPTAEGLVYFFDESGRLIDRFGWGEELTGLCVAHWGERTFLILTGPRGVFAFAVGPPSSE